MIRKILMPAFALGLIFASLAPTQAQDSMRTVELRLAGLSQGYTRPLRHTSARLEKVQGLSSVQALGHRSGVSSYTAQTTLSDEAIARALGLSLLDARNGALLLAPASAREAWRAEARMAILTMVDAIRFKAQRQRRNMWDDVPRMFGDNAGIEQCLKVLGLEPRILDGRFFKAKDYHIEDDGGWGGTFKVWAGEKYEGVPTGSYNDYDYRLQDAAEPDPNSKFVGAKLIVSAWNSGFWWVDIHGTALNAIEYERDVMTSNGKKLVVQAGAERIVKVLQAAAKYRFGEKAAKKSQDELVKGNLGNWQLKQELGLEDDYWDSWPHYNENGFSLSWFKHDNTGRLHVRVRALYPSHPLHLDGDLDVDAVKASEFNFDSVPVHWTVGAESDAGVFEARRQEIAAGMKVIQEALFVIAASLSTAKELSGAALCAALMLKPEQLKGEHFSAADYRLTPQMLGDVEIAAGSSATGGASWTLLNLGAKSTIRSYR